MTAPPVDPDTLIPCPTCKGMRNAHSERRDGTMVVSACPECRSPQGSTGTVLLGNPLSDPYEVTIDHCQGRFDCCATEPAA